jgi:hypothetical protein
LLNYKNSKLKRKERKSRSLRDKATINTPSLGVTLSEVTCGNLGVGQVPCA